MESWSLTLGEVTRSPPMSHTHPAGQGDRDLGEEGPRAPPRWVPGLWPLVLPALLCPFTCPSCWNLPSIFLEVSSRFVNSFIDSIRPHQCHLLQVDGNLKGNAKKTKGRNPSHSHSSSQKLWQMLSPGSVLCWNVPEEIRTSTRWRPSPRAGVLSAEKGLWRDPDFSRYVAVLLKATLAAPPKSSWV